MPEHGYKSRRPDQSIRRPTNVHAGAWLLAILTSAFSVVIAGQPTFPDAQNPPPPGWTGPVFKLSQTYPALLPPLGPVGQRPWMQFDFKKPAEAPKYLKAVLDYCLEGNKETDFVDVGQNPVRKWYHAPWLHSGPTGREFIRGMTKERPSRPPELGPAHTAQHDNWAVGFYNPRGAYTIGQVWKDPAHPDPRKAVFPSHTVACKLLFTTTPLAEVPFLDGSLEWEADIDRATGTGPRPKLRLLQLDVAVKDPRANSTIGWVFGTFQFEKAASASPNWWEHMVPVGLMWGSDVIRLKLNQPTQQEWINTARGQPLHLGRKNLVLNGPIDNPRGSCTSCHGFAQIARVNGPTPSLPSSPPADNATNAALDAYFRNVRAATALSGDYWSVDYSLQLQMGIARAVGAGQASLPVNLGVRGPVSGSRAPATKLPVITRDQ
jgi:hypothetical protein